MRSGSGSLLGRVPPGPHSSVLIIGAQIVSATHMLSVRRMRLTHCDYMGHAVPSAHQLKDFLHEAERKRLSGIWAQERR